MEQFSSSMTASYVIQQSKLCQNGSLDLNWYLFFAYAYYVENQESVDFDAIINFLPLSLFLRRMDCW